MFRTFDELPAAVREQWNAKSGTGTASKKDWLILKTLVFDEKFPADSPSALQSAAQAAALELYEFRDNANRKKGVHTSGIEHGSYQAIYTYALENLMEKMWRLHEELRAAGDVEALLSTKALPEADSEKRDQFRIYFGAALAILNPIMRRKLAESAEEEIKEDRQKLKEHVDDKMGEILAKRSSIRNHLAQWIEDRQAFEGLRKTHGGFYSNVFLDTIQHLTRASDASEPSGTLLPERAVRHHLRKEAVPKWRRDQSENEGRFIDILDEALAKKRFMTPKEREAITVLRELADSGREISDVALAQTIGVTEERAGQILAQIGAKLLEIEYIRPENLRQNHISLTPRLQKLLDDRAIYSGTKPGRE